MAYEEEGVGVVGALGCAVPLEDELEESEEVVCVCGVLDGGGRGCQGVVGNGDGEGCACDDATGKVGMVGLVFAKSR